MTCSKVSAMPTFLAIKAGQVVDTVSPVCSPGVPSHLTFQLTPSFFPSVLLQLKGADPPSLTRLVLTHKGPSPPLPPLPPAAESAKLAANAHFNAGRFADAADGYSEALALAPDSFALLGNRSLAYAKADPPRWEEALADAEAAVGVEERWGKGWVRVGEALEGLGRREEAVKAYEQAAANSGGAIQKGEWVRGGGVREDLGDEALILLWRRLQMRSRSWRP